MRKTTTTLGALLVLVLAGFAWKALRQPLLDSTVDRMTTVVGDKPVLALERALVLEGEQHRPQLLGSAEARSIRLELDDDERANVQQIMQAVGERTAEIGADWLDSCMARGDSDYNTCIRQWLLETTWLVEGEQPRGADWLAMPAAADRERENTADD